MNTEQYGQDKRIILTLDAGGTNFVFSAMQGNKEVVSPIRKPAFADDLDRSLETVIKGFEEVKGLVNLKNRLPSALLFRVRPIIKKESSGTFPILKHLQEECPWVRCWKIILISLSLSTMTETCLPTGRPSQDTCHGLMSN